LFSGYGEEGASFLSKEQSSKSKVQRAKFKEQRAKFKDQRVKFKFGIKKGANCAFFDL
jgi:hypothetical protein